MTDQNTAINLDDDAIAELIDDPARIQTHEIALEVISVLDAEIAHIQTQVDAATFEANVRPLSEDRQAWLRKACYAGAMKRSERFRVMQRDKEIRGTKGRAVTEPKHSKEERALKQQRLLAEVEDRRAKRLLALEEQKTRQMEIAQEKRNRPLELEIERTRRSVKEAADYLIEKEPRVGDALFVLEAILAQLHPIN